MSFVFVFFATVVCLVVGVCWKSLIERDLSEQVEVREHFAGSQNH
jgi:hypothetical protein